MDKAIYTFHKATQWNNVIIGIVARDIMQAVDHAPELRLNPLECVNYTLVKEEVKEGIHFKIEIENESYDG